MLYQLIMCVKGKIPNRVRSWVLESVSLTSDRTGLAWACVHGGRRPAGAPAYTMSSDPRGASPQPQQYKPICPPGRGGEEEPSQRCWTGPRTTLGTSWFMSGVWSDRTPENPLPKSSEAPPHCSCTFLSWYSVPFRRETFYLLLCTYGSSHKRRVHNLKAKKKKGEGGSIIIQFRSFRAPTSLVLGLWSRGAWEGANGYRSQKNYKVNGNFSSVLCIYYCLQSVCLRSWKIQFPHWRKTK